jgi:hypothetical protein
MKIYNLFYEKSIYLVWKIRLSAINSDVSLYYTRYYTHGIKLFYTDSIKEKKI